MDSPNERRIVLLGKTGDGKSSTGKTIVGDENAFTVGHDPTSETSCCTFKKKRINDKDYTVIDSPGYFDTKQSGEELEIEKCITQCSPGPHAFLIVLRVGRYTEHEEEVIKKITRSFGEDALKYAVVLFTFGYQLKGQTIEDFVKKSPVLTDLVQKCGDRCHVIDNEHWNQDHEYCSNRVQVEKLLNTIEKMITKNGGGYYTNDMLLVVRAAIIAEQQRIANESQGLTEEEMQQRAKGRVRIRLVGLTTGALLGALLGIPVCIAAVVRHIGGYLQMLAKMLQIILEEKLGATNLGLSGIAAVGFVGHVVKENLPRATTEGAGALVGTKVALIGGGAVVACGAVMGGFEGVKAAENAQTSGEAAVMAYDAVIKLAKNLLPKEDN